MDITLDTSADTPVAVSRLSARPWLRHYPAGIPAELDFQAPGTPATLKELMRQGFARFAQAPAFSQMGSVLSYRQLDEASRDFGAFLQHRWGLRRGDRIVLMLPNVLQFPVALVGALRAGLVVVPVNPQCTARELLQPLQDSGAAAVVVLEQAAHTLQEVLDTHPKLKPAVVVSAVGDLLTPMKEWMANLLARHVRHAVPPWRLPGAVPFKRALHEGAQHLLDDLPLRPQDLALLAYTGGATGAAKGVMLTHRNLVANVMQVRAWIARDLVEGEETAVVPLPLFHPYALTCTLTFLALGAHTVLVPNPRDVPDFLATLRKVSPSVVVGVNTLYRALLDSPGFNDVDLRRLKVCAAGGMAVQREVAQRWKQRTGVPLLEGYGLTEASPVVTSNPLDITDWTGSIGLPLPSTEVAVLDEAGHELPPGTVGELAVRGPQVMRGYWNRPQETAQAFTAQGWMRTGDMGFMDPRGVFRLTDRKKDMIIVSGFKVFPVEVEEVAALHPGVLEAAAVGLPDAQGGEAVKLVVVRADPALTAEALLAHCRKHLMPYKVPRRVEFRQEPLPRSALGKVLRRRLRTPVLVRAEAEASPAD